jgi:hypothetical protein
MGFCLPRDVSGSGSVPTLPEPRTQTGTQTGLQPAADYQLAMEQEFGHLLHAGAGNARPLLDGQWMARWAVPVIVPRCQPWEVTPSDGHVTGTANGVAAHHGS